MDQRKFGALCEIGNYCVKLQPFACPGKKKGVFFWKCVLKSAKVQLVLCCSQFPPEDFSSRSPWSRGCRRWALGTWQLCRRGIFHWSQTWVDEGTHTAGRYDETWVDHDDGFAVGYNIQVKSHAWTWLLDWTSHGWHTMPALTLCFGFGISTERFDGRFKAGLRYKALASYLLIYLHIFTV